MPEGLKSMLLISTLVTLPVRYGKVTCSWLSMALWNVNQVSLHVLEAGVPVHV